MAYKKRTTKRYTRRRTLAPQSTLQKAFTTASKALKLAMYMKGMINCEKKYADIAYSGGIDYNGAINLITNIAQGSDVGNRDGNSILVRSLNFKQVWRIVGTTDTNVRTIIFLDTQNTGSAPTVSDVLQAIGTVTAPLSPLQVDHLTRYKILGDYKFILSVNDKSSREIARYMKLYFHEKFTGPLATDIYKNALYVLNISDKIASVPTVEAYHRLGYYDN